MARVPQANTRSPAPEPPVAHARHARLRERIKALLARRGPRPEPEAATSRLPGSSWPDSFFDVDAGP